MGTFLFGIGAGYAVSKAMSWITHPAYTARFGSPHVTNAVAELIAKCGRQWASPSLAVDAITEHLGAAAKQAGASEIVRDFLVDMAIFRRSRLELAMLVSDSPADWRKLLHLKAPLRVLLCDSPALAANDLKDFVRLLAGYSDHRTGEEYLVLNWRRERNVLHAHVWRAPADRKAPPATIRFQRLPGFPKPAE